MNWLSIIHNSQSIGTDQVGLGSDWRTVMATAGKKFFITDPKILK